MTFATADLVDLYDAEVSSCSTQLRQFGATRVFSGPLVTVQCLQDNLLLKQALTEPGNGRVLVVDGGGSLATALMGDQIGALAVKNGWSGVIINGAVRDTVALAALAVGIKALGTNPKKSTKLGTGTRAVPVSFGGVTFAPGHWLYSDDDGILTAARPLALPG